MTHTKTTRCFIFMKPYYLSFFITFLFLCSCASSNKFLTNQEYNNYQGTIVLMNGERKMGQVGMPSQSNKYVLFINEGKENERIAPEDIDRIEFTPDYLPDNLYVMRYMLIKGTFGKKSKNWVLCISEGPNVAAYIGAYNYTINTDGSIGLGGIRQVINNGNGTMVVNPSFPIYMMKKADNALKIVTLTKGISFEESSFRSGLAHFLSDDSKLTDYIHQEKWTLDNLPTIVQNYEPNRGNTDLIIDGKVVVLRKPDLITSDLNKEMLFYVESAFPSDNIYGTQFGIGIRSTLSKFFTYGIDFGYASAKYVDQAKRLENHGINEIQTIPVEDRDLSKQGLFKFNGTVGAQLPFRVNKIYLIPGVHLALGGTLGSDYSALYYGPMGTFDIGFRMKQGNIIMLGAGYRRNIPWKNDEDKEEASAPGFKAYEPYNNLLFRVGYKF